MLKIPHCLDNQLTDGSKVVSPTQPATLYCPETLFFYFSYSFLLEAEQTPGLVWLEGLGKSKNLFTSSGLELCLNHHTSM
jgi:hypothetical protein